MISHTKMPPRETTVAEALYVYGHRAQKTLENQPNMPSHLPVADILHESAWYPYRAKRQGLRAAPD